MRRVAALAFLLASLPVPLRPQAGDRLDAMLEMGIAQVGEGDFETAVFTLDSVVRRLADRADAMLPRALLYLGAAYVGLDHEDAARGKFRDAAKLDRALRASPDRFPVRVVDLFEHERLKLTAAKSRRGRKIALIAAGVGGATAVGISAATSPQQNRPPLAIISVTPEGLGIANVTRLTFTASANDPDGDALSFAWDLGDGRNASGETTSHVYDRPGAFLVRLTVRDVKGASTTATVQQRVESLTGTWVSQTPQLGCTLQDHFVCTQSGTAVDCLDPPADSCFSLWRLTLAHPRSVVGGQVVLRDGRANCIGGEVAADLNRVTCGGSPVMTRVR